MKPEDKSRLLREVGMLYAQAVSDASSGKEAIAEAGSEIMLGDESLPSLDTTSNLNTGRVEKLRRLVEFVSSIPQTDVVEPGAQINVTVIYPDDRELDYTEDLIVTLAELNGIPSLPGLPKFLSETSPLIAALNGKTAQPYQSVSGKMLNGLNFVAHLNRVR